MCVLGPSNNARHLLASASDDAQSHACRRTRDQTHTLCLHVACFLMKQNMLSEPAGLCGRKRAEAGGSQDRGGYLHFLSGDVLAKICEASPRIPSWTCLTSS